jgi:hypothetical protein
MKKLLTLLFIGISLFSYAQSLQLTDPKGTPYTDGQTLSATITEDNLDPLGEFVTEIMIHNLSDATLDVETFRTNITLVEGMSAYVCFGVCANDSAFSMNYPIDAGDETEYALHIEPKGKFGESKFQLDFMIPGEKITLYVIIDMQSLGVKEQKNEKISLSAYPNPVNAGSIINITFTLADKSNAHKLIIRNLLGVEVMSMPLNPYENSISVNIAPLVSGVYFYAIENTNQIIVTKKLIVK